MITHESDAMLEVNKNLYGMDELRFMSSNGKRVISVLVVDDDNELLESLRKEPTLNRQGWVLRVCKTGEAALAAMKEGRVDVFVSNLVLPDMNGVAFLRAVKEASPNSLRLIMHGKDDRELLTQSIGLNHRRVEKPVSVAALALMIRQVLVTHLRIRKPEVSAIVRDTKQLHVNTQPMQELLKTADNPECEVDDLAEIIAKHPTAVATILQVANTAFYGAAGGVDTVQEALHLLGMDFVRNLAITELAKKQLRLSPGLQELANSILQHSIETSQYGFRMRQFVKNLSLIQQLSSLALLHDLGKLVLLASKGHDYADLMGQSVDSNTPSWRLEKMNYGCDHAAVGGFLFSMWGLPEVIVRAVTWHHQPEKVAEKGFCPTSLLHFSNYAAHSNQGVSCYCGDRLNEELAEKQGLALDYVLDFE